MYRQDKKHINVDTLSREYEVIRSSCDDDDFNDVVLFSTEMIPNEYIEI